MNRWIVPALCALGIHAVLFNIDPEWTQPVYSVTESRAVSISLTEVPPASRMQKRIAPLAPPRTGPVEPLRPIPLRPKTPPAVKPDPTPAPAAAPVPPQAAAHIEPTSPPAATPDPAGLAEPALSETAAEEPAGRSASDHPPADQDQSQIQASVPLYTLNPPPAYPAIARRRNYQGTVLLDVLVDHQGRAAQVKIGRSCGYPVLDQSAVASVRQWRFEPARRLGRPIEMWVQVPVRFALE